MIFGILQKYVSSLFLFSYLVSIYFYDEARAWLSISMFGFIGCILLFNKPHDILNRFRKATSFWVFGSFFFILSCYYFNSSDYDFYLRRLQIKIPLFALSLAFATYSVYFNRLFYKLYLMLFILVTTLACSITLIHFVLNYETIVRSYLEAKVIPTMINHVRFSILTAYACYLCYFIYNKSIIIKYRIEKFIVLFLGLFLFIFLHIYSVRSGLVAIYGAIATEILRYALRTRNYVKIGLLCCLLILGVFCAGTYIPTMNNKFVNTKADIKTYIIGGYPNYSSLTTRLISFEAGWHIFINNPVFGCGLGDIKFETDAYFNANYPMIETPILPHNQFLFYLASTGIVGLFFFCFTFYFPLFYRKNWKRNHLLLIGYVILTLSFMTEPMLETQLGMAVSLLLILVPLSKGIT